MKNAISLALATLCAVSAVPQSARACTTFAVEGEEGPLVGKSYDWSIGHGLVLFNKRGVAKRALVLDPRNTPAEWSSKYASLTFNQYGRELPNGGMNTEGLVVEIMWLGSARSAPLDPRPTVNELQWIQVQLDRFSTVAEVVAHVDDLRISRVHGSVHYMVCDRSGECASIEHLAGNRAEVTTGADMPVKALTNDTYEESMEFLRRHSGFGGSRPTPSGSGSLARFARAAERVNGRKIEPGEITTYALQVLDDVRSGTFTKWNIVYDPARLEISFRTLASSDLKAVSLDSFESSCATPARMLDIDFERPGNVSSSFTEYSSEANARLIHDSLEGLGIQNRLPAGAEAALASLPDTYECTELETVAAF